MSHRPIQLIVGLGNPGPQYEKTRHNVGVWFVEKIATQAFQPVSKFFGLVSKATLGNQECFLLIPTTFMNHSGRSISALANYYKIPPEAILVAHDDLDLPAGQVRLKKDGGHGGHNGVRDVIAQLGSKQFHRLRIGIGHPGNREQVLDYVLSRPSKMDEEAIMTAIDSATSVMDEFISGNVDKAVQKLHTSQKPVVG